MSDSVPPWTIDEMMERWGHVEKVERLPAPPYQPDCRAHSVDCMLSIRSLESHMSDEGWQLQQSLWFNGYRQFYADQTSVGIDYSDVENILALNDPVRTLFIQDRREWDRRNSACFDASAQFSNVGHLASRPDIFKVTVLKDAQHDLHFHRDSAAEMGIHAWVHYYHPRIVSSLSSYVRPEHMIRTWHTIDKRSVPFYHPAGRRGALLSGAIHGKYYPLRLRIKRNVSRLRNTEYLEHPGYGVGRSCTNEFLQTLAKYRVAICTSSIYGYALRKIIEATACGCVVITDLPVDDRIPDIDGNLIRVRPDIAIERLSEIIDAACDGYDHHRQAEFARLAIKRFDYLWEGVRLAGEIQYMRQKYAGGS